MQTLILTLHIVVCVLLVILVLLQAGKEGMGVIFGGGNSSVFGSSGAGGILAKLTAFMAVVFVATSLSYTFVTSPRPQTESTILDVKIEEPAPAKPEAVPAKPATAPAKPEATSEQSTAKPSKPEAATTKPEAIPSKSETIPAKSEGAPVQPAEKK
ncbi:MAG: preprotein translocase subunit SecG [Desulfovibrio sp.]|nr:preprotein translocase subunit SecG [Desulfovibrio sp.]